MRSTMIVLAHLVRRQVDRDAHAQALVAPGARLPAGVLDDPVAERADQAEALGDRDEARRAPIMPRGRMLPAQQRLGRRDLAARASIFGW